MAEEITVLLADDHPVVRGGLRALFDTLDGIRVVAEASDGAGAIREALLNRPDVILLDVRMPGMGGIDAARRIAIDVPEAGIIMLTMVDDDVLVTDALQAGARGYLLKGAESDEIERAVRSVAAGDAVFSSAVVPGVVGRMRGPASTPAIGSLTARERQLLDLIARGLSNTAISERMGIAPKTVGNHISSVFLKLRVATRAEAIVLARDAGFGR